jgi:hypothetical protein
MEMVLLNEPLLLAGSENASGSFGYYSAGEISGWYQLGIEDLD